VALSLVPSDTVMGMRIEFQNVSKCFGTTKVLENVSLTIEEGEFVALIGPSGCGKTTLLRMLMSEENPSSGRILLNGHELPGEPDRERGVVFQKYSVFPHLTVLQNILLADEFQKAPILGFLFGTRKACAVKKADELLRSVGLAEAREKYPHQLSGGMQQRLAIAQAIACHPKVLLLDEPFGALDAHIKQEVHDLVRRLWHEAKLTIILVTHDLAEAKDLATRIISIGQPGDDRRRPSQISNDTGVNGNRVSKGGGVRFEPPQSMLKAQSN
jgi:NitT/TauT family transport system ATP-binding protein